MASAGSGTVAGLLLVLLSGYTLMDTVTSDYTDYDSVYQNGDNSVNNLTNPAESRLKHYLVETFRFLTQQSKPRPVLNVLKPLLVNFEIHLIQILDFNQKEQKMTTQLWKQFKWRDEYITWNPDEFDGIKQIHIGSDLIWKPDIILYNNYGGTDSGDTNVQLIVSHEGQVLWMPPAILHSSCQVDLTNFPFDTQHCTLEFGSWIYSVRELDITKGNSSLNMKRYIPNMEWEVGRAHSIKQEIIYECCEDPFVLITYQFQLIRNYGYYARVMLLPVLLLSIIAVFIFCVPAQRPDRTPLGLNLFTSFMLLLLLVVDISPPSVASKLSTYLSACVGIVTSAIVVSILLINITTWTTDVPCWIRVIFLEKIACCVFPFTKRGGRNFRQNGSEAASNDITQSLQGTREGSTTPRREQSEWILLVNVLDRLLFIVYTVILAVCVALYFPSPRWNATIQDET